MLNSLTRFALRSHHTGVLLEDDHIVVLDKPAGLLVVPDRFDPDVPNLASLFRSGGEKVFTVHRLDKDTSGCIVFAKTAEAHAFLNAEFESHTVVKRYAAICRGSLADETGVIDLPIGEDRGRHAMRVDRKKGKESRTEFSVTERFQGFTLVEARPMTGRTHQVRVHMMALGHPIVSDPLYGDGEPFFLSRTKRNYRKGKKVEKPLLSRTALHAESLVVRHPVTHEEIIVSSPFHKDMRSVVRMLRKYAPGPPS